MAGGLDRLPPLPPSDDKSLSDNRFDSFYEKTPKSFWEGNEIHHTVVEKPKKCEHYFEYTQDGVVCVKCHAGLIGKGLEIRDGVLYFNNKKIL